MLNPASIAALSLTLSLALAPSAHASSDDRFLTETTSLATSQPAAYDELASLESVAGEAYDNPDDDPYCATSEEQLLELGASEETVNAAAISECYCPHDAATQQVQTDLCGYCNGLNCRKYSCSVQPIGGGPVTKVKCEWGNPNGGGCSTTDASTTAPIGGLMILLSVGLLRRRRR